jgi:hypothetical protein
LMTACLVKSMGMRSARSVSGGSLAQNIEMARQVLGDLC